MKELKAYIRRDEVNEVVAKLREAGAPGVSIIEIHPVGYGYEPNCFESRKAGPVQQYRYLAIAKLEIFCGDDQLESLLEVMHTCCRTGNAGDGMIFVSDIADAIRIRDGVRGEDALGCKGSSVGARRIA